jgi:effector-binding domain-containing protein
MLKFASIVLHSFLATALLQLAFVAESRAAETADVQLEEIKPQPAMSIRFRAKPKELGPKFGKSMGVLYTYVYSHGGEVIGPPFGRYHDMDDESFDVEAGVPVAKVIAGNDQVKQSELPGGEVATLLYRGPYTELGESHDTLKAWAESKGREAAGGSWEVYLIGPSQESDPAKYETKLYLPLKKKKKGETPPEASPSSN